MLAMPYQNNRRRCSRHFQCFYCCSLRGVGYHQGNALLPRWTRIAQKPRFTQISLIFPEKCALLLNDTQVTQASHAFISN